MAKKLKRRLPAILLFVVIFQGCEIGWASFRVMTGNLHYGRGQYQKAILQYLHTNELTAMDIRYYNLGNVYYALGEGKAALNNWVKAEHETHDPDILFRIEFNRGVLYYQWGRFNEAYQSFRRALTINPADNDTKINLEESFLRIRAPASRQQEESVIEKEGVSRESERLLRYIREKEVKLRRVSEESERDFEEDW